VKRALQICTSLVTRHRRQVDKGLKRLCAAAGRVVNTGAIAMQVSSVSSQII
jgi:hypothetical protein